VPGSEGEQRLKRRIGLLGVFSFGYADVGAGIYMTLGLVASYAGPATPVAFAVASISSAILPRRGFLFPITTTLSPLRAKYFAGKSPM